MRFTKIRPSATSPAANDGIRVAFHSRDFLAGFTLIVRLNQRVDDIPRAGNALAAGLGGLKRGRGG